jgi:predicted nucleotidyltransferase
MVNGVGVILSNKQAYLEEIKQRLKSLNPYKIILFGSCATQNYDEDSDIDILVILDSDEISQNYEEKMNKNLMVRNAIWDVSGKVPIDLLVYTRKEFEILMNNKNSFFREIEATGKTIYERAS